MVIQLDLTGHEVIASLTKNVSFDQEKIEPPRTKINYIQVTDECEEDDAGVLWITGSEDGESYSVCLDISIDGKPYTEDEFIKRLRITAQLNLE